MKVKTRLKKKKILTVAIIIIMILLLLVFTLLIFTHLDFIIMCVYLAYMPYIQLARWFLGCKSQRTEKVWVNSSAFRADQGAVDHLENERW